MKRVLLTGAAGRVGTAFLEHVGEQYELRLVDRHLDGIEVRENYEKIVCDLSDLDQCQEVCADMDTVLHLAADPYPGADFYESLLDNNIKAMYNIFRAAKDQGCQRVIFASSIQVIEGYPLDIQPRHDSPIKPRNMYAAAKAFGEATAYYFAHEEELSCIAVRIGAFEGNSTEPIADGRRLSAFVSKRDLSHLFVQCIETPDVQFAIFQAVSDNRFKRMDITSAREMVGYQPQDDAFVRFNTGIQYGQRWHQAPERYS